MKNLKIIAVILIFLTVMPAARLLAQYRKAPKTNSARAAYGYPAESKSKKKRKKNSKAFKAKTKAKQPLNREKKNPWAS